ncbi:MAG TPA: lasso peptide biosynthesis B2 protein [Pyrinomonadaceae bacterium]|nr:lasso peptide biosynthesis B2 protein [Pyrinomonadaceae bacterium]
MARMAVWVLVLSAVVRIWSLPRALRLISIKGKPDASITDDQELPTAIDAILGVNVSVFKPICWKRAAVLHRYLGLRGLESTIVFGVRKEAAGELKGHAWLEHEGQPIFEPSPPAYTVTYTFPSMTRQMMWAVGAENKLDDYNL